MQSQMQDQDVFIKDEGYAAVKFLSDRAKEVAYSLGIPNSLQDNSRYECAYDEQDVDKLVQVLTEKGLKVETEI